MIGSASRAPSPIGKGVDQQHLRSILVHSDALPLGQPELFLQDAGAIADGGTVTDDEVRDLMTGPLETFAGFVRARRSDENSTPQALAT